MAGLTKRLRAILSEEPQGSLGVIYTALEGESLREINKALERLARRGELTLKGSRYCYALRESRKGPVQQRIWSAMRNLAKVNRVMGLEDVVLLSGASLDYVRRYAGYLVEQKHLARRKADGAYVMMAPNLVKAPAWNRRKAGAGKGGDRG